MCQDTRLNHFILNTKDSWVCASKCSCHLFLHSTINTKSLECAVSKVPSLPSIPSVPLLFSPSEGCPSDQLSPSIPMNFCTKLQALTLVADSLVFSEHGNDLLMLFLHPHSLTVLLNIWPLVRGYHLTHPHHYPECHLGSLSVHQWHAVSWLQVLDLKFLSDPHHNQSPWCYLMR